MITRLNGEAIQDASLLKLRVAETAPGLKVPVIVTRNGTDKTLHVTLGNTTENLVIKRNEINGAGEGSWQPSELLIWIKTLDPS